MLALTVVIDEESVRTLADHGSRGQRVQHGALLADRARVLRAARVVTPLVGAGEGRGAVGVNSALGILRDNG